MVGRVEPERGGGQTVGNEVDPKKLHREERFRHAKEDGKEDTVDSGESSARRGGSKRDDWADLTTSPMLDEMR